ncbi:MAG TPA: mobilization protein [Steroidobacteraceae bacterium]|nr:mobilization protein [Steroidobacteraceae bacterium]
MPKLDDQISTLQERLKQLKLRQQRIDARKRAIETMRERKAETRRQFVVGSVILAKVQEGAMNAMQLREWLDQTLTRKDDRALFQLPPKGESPQDAISTAPETSVPAPADTGPGQDSSN